MTKDIAAPFNEPRQGETPDEYLERMLARACEFPPILEVAISRADHPERRKDSPIEGDDDE